jgi:sulfite reductase (NADPH) flavoprotein alpha-component
LQQALHTQLDIKKLSASFWNMLEQALHADEQETYKTLTQKSMLELQDVLRLFPQTAKNIDTQTLVNSLALLQPRYYSIASSQSMNAEQMDLAVAGQTFNIESDKRFGVASYFLNHQLQPGNSIKVFVQKNPHFRLPPADENKHCVMIGAGTGVAPYRAFMQELAQRAETPATQARHLLFFGCRHEQADFLYRDEWLAWQSQGLLEVHCAFSRDQPQKIYVQDRLREQAQTLWQRMQAGDHFYICGDATHMAVAVEAALLDVIAKQGEMSGQEAKKYLEEMSKGNRYQKDVWV